MKISRLLPAILLCSAAVVSQGCGLGALGSTALVAWIAVDSGGGDDNHPAPQPAALPPAGSVWTDPAAETVKPGETVTVRIMLNSDTAVVGSYSMRITYDSSAFTLQSVSGGSSPLGAPFLTDTAAAGAIFISDMNSADPDPGAKGVQEVAVLTFLAAGTSGSQMRLEGRLMNLANLEYPAEDIGATSLPRNLKVGQDVVIE